MYEFRVQHYQPLFDLGLMRINPSNRGGKYSTMYSKYNLYQPILIYIWQV